MLFVLPAFFLWLSWVFLLRWKRSFSAWRLRSALFALGVAFISTTLHLIWNISWLRSGGSPHGMPAAPGLWQGLGPVMFWTFVLATALSLLLKGASRLFLLGWSSSMVFVFFAIYVLQMD
jgi:hypothetical protein